MNTSPAEIERIVREVLARLTPGAASCGCAPAASPGATTSCSCGCRGAEAARVSSPASATPGVSAASSGVLLLTDAVVGVREIRDRLSGVRQVRVGRRAVVTPAVRDLLKERGVALLVGDAAPGAGTTSGGVPIAVGVSETNYEPSALLQAMTRRGADVQRIANTGLVGVIDELTDAVGKSGKRGLLLTEATAAGACLANRVRGVRAIAGESLPALRRDVAQVAANLLVVSPVGRGFHELLQMIHEFATSGGPCPDAWRVRLG